MMLLMRRLGVYVILLLFILWCQAKQTSVESRRTLLNQTADKNDLHKNGQHMMNIDVTISKKVSSYQNFVKGAGLYNGMCNL